MKHQVVNGVEATIYEAGDPLWCCGCPWHMGLETSDCSCRCHATPRWWWGDVKSAPLKVVEVQYDQ